MNTCKLEWKKRIFMTNFNKESVRLMGVSMHPLPKLTCTHSIEDTLYSWLKIAEDCFIGTIHKWRHCRGGRRRWKKWGLQVIFKAYLGWLGEGEGVEKLENWVNVIYGWTLTMNAILIDSEVQHDLDKSIDNMLNMNVTIWHVIWKYTQGAFWEWILMWWELWNFIVGEIQKIFASKWKFYLKLVSNSSKKFLI